MNLRNLKLDFNFSVMNLHDIKLTSFFDENFVKGLKTFLFKLMISLRICLFTCNFIIY